MSKRLNVIKAVLAVGLVLSSIVAATAQQVAIASRTAKTIYYEPPGTTEQPPKKQNVAVRFWIELHPRDGSATRTVAADYEFHSGDRIRFRVATSNDCYVYVAYQGTTGNRALLFPSLKAGRNTRVKRHQAKIMPSTRGYFTFDRNPGKEHVVIVVSPKVVPALDAIAQVRVGKDVKTRNIILTDKENEIWSKIQKKLTGKDKGASTRDLLFEEEKSGEQVGNYYAQPTGFTEAVLINVTLNHKP